MSVVFKKSPQRSVGAYEAKTHLPKLLKEVEENGSTITITNNGRPVAQLAPIPEAAPTDIRAVIESINEFRSRQKGKGFTLQEIKEFIEDGRK